MLKHVLTAAVCGLVGLALGCGIVAVAVSNWRELSTHWLNSGVVLPILGLLVGMELAEKSIGENRNTLRMLLAVFAIPLGAMGNLLAFVITSRTWFGDKIAAAHQAFTYQLMHPDVLPTFVSRSSSGSTGTEQTWLMFVVLGCVLGPVIFWWSSKSPILSQN